MDNFHFDITSNGGLEDWLKLCMGQYHKAVGWSEHDDDKGKRIVFYWVDPRGSVSEYWPLPAPAKSPEVAQYVKTWLDNADYGRQPDHDGDNGRGFRLYNEGWGHVDGHYQAIFAVQPRWAMYGK